MSIEEDEIGAFLRWTILSFLHQNFKKHGITMNLLIALDRSNCKEMLEDLLVKRGDQMQIIDAIPKYGKITKSF